MKIDITDEEITTLARLLSKVKEGRKSPRKPSKKEQRKADIHQYLDNLKIPKK